MKNWVLAVVVVLLVGCTAKVNVQTETVTPVQTSSAFETPKSAKNIIFLVGDGMGVTQITSGMLSNNNTLHLERMKHIGFSKTSSTSGPITDSAAGATAFSIGEKTFNGAVGVDNEGNPKTTLLELLGNQGYSTGLIATCKITHATPASYYAHQKSRNMGYEIAADMVQAPVNLFIGGGKSHFENRTNPDEGQIDDRNIISELEAKGFTFVNSLTELASTSGNVGYFIAEGHPKAIKDGRDDIFPRSIQPSIAHLQKESDKGFFLIAEGAQIDWGGHANDGNFIVTEMLDFDQAVGQALDFAEQDGNTLVVVTADHETGGFALGANGRDYSDMQAQFTTPGHSAVMVPVYAFGPGAEYFMGTYENNTIYAKMLAALGK
ncbi:MAG: alkaline phosphatase [Saprospiraceae bacterium]|nr:alkaline phosphatase [Saprospiraceae bacterium]